MQVHYDPSYFVKVYLPVEALVVLESDHWYWWPSKMDAYPTSYQEGSDDVSVSLRQRIGLLGDHVIVEPSGSWDLRGCTSVPNVCALSINS